MQASKSYKIFGHGRGIDISQPITGRNAYPFPQNRKLEVPGQRQVQSPFEGYVPATSESSLAYSQVNQFTVNSEITRKVIREELAKMGDFGAMRNQVNIIKVQLRDVKDVLLKRNDEELKKEIFKDVDKILSEYHEQTAKSLRQVIKKMDENIKKDCLTKFLPLDFVNDVEKQFLQMQDRVQLVESKVSGSSSQSHKQDSVLLAQNIDMRLKKAQRQSQFLKKTLQQLQASAKLSSQTCNSLINKLDEQSQTYSKKIQDSNKIIAQIGRQLKSMNIKLQNLINTQEQFNGRINGLEEKGKDFTKGLSNKFNNQSSSSDVKQFLVSDRGLTTSTVFQSSKNIDSNSSKDIVTNLRPKFAQNASGLFNESLKAQSPGFVSRKQAKEDVRMFYQIDKNNFLLDEDGKYLLNEHGNQIKLTEEQLQFLRKSTLVKLQQ